MHPTGMPRKETPSVTDIRDDLPNGEQESTAAETVQESAEPDVAETAKAPPEEEKPSGKGRFGKSARELKEAKDKIDSLTKELSETKDHLLRQAAEYDNFRKRTTRERAEIYPSAVAQTVAQFLPVIDNFERALAACEGDAGEEFRKGFELIGRQMQEVLEKLGIEAIDPVGQPFDPETCNAVMHIEDEAVDTNIVVEVFQKGYKLGDRMVRHAMVKVAN